MNSPFIIYALPRSRTAWLSSFLTYGDWECYHESAMFMRSMDDVRKFFNSGNVGCAETAAAQGYQLIRHAAPNITEVVILRPVDEVVNSLIKAAGTNVYDEKILRRNMEYGHRMLLKIAQDNGVMTVNYDDLNREDVCAAIFEYCLPYEFDKEWWESLKDKNIQVNLMAVLRYYNKNRNIIDRFKNHCRKELSRLCRAHELPMVRV